VFSWKSIWARELLPFAFCQRGALFVHAINLNDLSNLSHIDLCHIDLGGLRSKC
jgi:hypothetical protein